MRAQMIPALLTAVFLIGGASDALKADDEPTIPCGARQDVLRHLADRFAEAPIGIGLGGGGGVVEILIARDGQTWSLLVTTPAGETCLIGMGTGWQIVPWRAPVIQDHPT